MDIPQAAEMLKKLKLTHILPQDALAILGAAVPAEPVAPIVAARYRNGTGRWTYTDTAIGSIEADGWNQVEYLCNVDAAAAQATPPAQSAPPAAPAPAPELAGALITELRAVCAAADSGAGGWVPTSRIKEAIAITRAQSGAPAPAPTMEDAIAAGDGTLHGAIDYWQDRALRAESGAPAPAPQPWVPMHERAPDPGTECVVLVRYTLDRPPFATVDKWDVQREDPTGMGGPTLETGEGWNDNDENDVIAWIANPPHPPADWDQRITGGATGGSK